jgi:hypothetical protein
MTLVAIGDRAGVVASVTLPSDDRGDWDWRTEDMSGIEDSRIPRDDPQIEAICVDGAGRVLLLQEIPARVELVDFAARRVASSIALEVPMRHPLADAWADPDGSRGEGAVLLRNGHLLIAKEKDPPAFIEFGPAGEAPSGFHAGAGLAEGARWDVAEGELVFTALQWWEPGGSLADGCEDFSDLEVGPDGRLYVLSDKSRSVARLDVLDRDGGPARADRIWRIDGLDGKPEGLAFSPQGRAIVALDTRKAKHNLVVLDPPLTLP